MACLLEEDEVRLEEAGLMIRRLPLLRPPIRPVPNSPKCIPSYDTPAAHKAALGPEPVLRGRLAPTKIFRHSLAWRHGWRHL